MAIGSTLSVGLIGLKAFIVQVQAFISWLAILQHHRIAGCIVVRSPRAREISVSSHWIRLAANPCDREHEPAAMPKRGSSHDLAIAASVLCAAGAIGHDC